MRSARGTVPETEIDPRRDLHGAQSRIGGTCEDANRAGQGKRSQGPVKKPAARLKLVGMKMLTEENRKWSSRPHSEISIVPISNFQCSRSNRKWTVEPALML